MLYSLSNITCKASVNVERVEITKILEWRKNLSRDLALGHLERSSSRSSRRRRRRSQIPKDKNPRFLAEFEIYFGQFETLSSLSSFLLLLRKECGFLEEIQQNLTSRSSLTIEQSSGRKERRKTDDDLILDLPP